MSATINSLDERVLVGTEIFEVSTNGTGSFKSTIIGLNTLFQEKSEKGAASGYAELDSFQKLLLANFPSGSSLQVLRRNAANTALEFATLTQGITSINTDTTSAQIIAAGTGISIIDAGATHTLSIDNTVVTLTGSQVLTNKIIDDFSNLVFADGEHVKVRNSSGATLTKGDVVYVSGFNAGQVLPEVSKTNASSASTMPALGIVNETINNSADGEVIIAGVMTGLNTSAFTAGDILFASTTPGVLTNVQPTGTALIQNVATVLRSNPTNGVIAIVATSDVNALPNIPDAQFWIGDATALPTPRTMSGDATLSNLGVLTISASFAQSTNNLSFFSATTSAQLLSVISDETGSGLLVFGTSPTIITPTITSFTNSLHNHSDNPGGGQLVATNALTATGTKDNTTFLRGDNTWAVPVGSETTFIGFTADDNLMMGSFNIQFPSDSTPPSDSTTAIYRQSSDLILNVADFDSIFFRNNNSTQLTIASGQLTTPSGTNLNVGGDVVVGKRIQGKRGAEVASGTTITLGDGNLFNITGNTTISRITTTGWQIGSMVTLILDSPITLDDGGPSAANTATLALRNAANYDVPIGRTVTFVLDTLAWREIARQDA